MPTTQRILSKSFDESSRTFKVCWEVSGLNEIEEILDSDPFALLEVSKIRWYLQIYKIDDGFILSLIPVNKDINKSFKYYLVVKIGLVNPKLFDLENYGGEEITIEKIDAYQTHVNLSLEYSEQAMAVDPFVNYRSYPSNGSGTTRNLFCDVKFRVKDQIFEAHRYFLSRVSEVFLKMFTADTKDAKMTEPIEVTDSTPEGFKAFLDSLYDHENLPKDVDLVLQVLKLAEKYSIEYFLGYLQIYIVTMITEETVIRILIAADMNRALELKRAAMDFLTTRLVEKLPNFSLLLKPEHENLVKDLLIFRPPYQY